MGDTLLWSGGLCASLVNEDVEIQVYIRVSQIRESDDLRSNERQPFFHKTHKYVFGILYLNGICLI